MEKQSNVNIRPIAYGKIAEKNGSYTDVMYSSSSVVGANGKYETKGITHRVGSSKKAPIDIMKLRIQAEMISRAGQSQQASFEKD